MDGVVIYVARNRSRAIIWCADHGPLGLARRDALPPASQPALQVGDLVRFEMIEEAGTRLCGRLTVLAPDVMPELPVMLRQGNRAEPRSTPLRVIQGGAGGIARFPSGGLCG